MNGDQTLTVC